MARYPKYYLKLRHKLEEMDLVPYEYFGKCIGMTESQIKSRLYHKAPWEIEEIYRAMDIIKEPYELIPLYFPKGGIIEKEPPQKAAQCQ